MPKQAAQLEDFIAAMEEVSDDVQKSFGSLSSQQLNWKASAESWSIAQCLEHLIKANAPYAPLIESATDPGRKPSLWERVPVIPGLLGNLLAEAVSPQAARRLKAPAKFAPSRSSVSADVVSRFMQTQNKVLALMKSSAHLDLKGIIVTSPALSVITYSLLDGYRIISNHEQRHLAQAKRVLNSAGFPTA